MSGGDSANGATRLRAARPVLGVILVCFLAGAALQPLWGGTAAGGYSIVISGVAERLLPWLQPAPIVVGLAPSGTRVSVRSEVHPGGALGAVETAHFTFYMPFVVLLLVVAWGRLRLVSAAEVALILALLFCVQVVCLDLGVLRLAVLSLVPAGGPPLVGGVEYNVLHALYHTYANFGPELWNGLVIGFVLIRGAHDRSRATQDGLPRRRGIGGGLATASAVLLLPSVLYIVVAPAVRRLNGQASVALLAAARVHADTGHPDVAGLLARQVLRSGRQELPAMMLLGAIETEAHPDAAEEWYRTVLAKHPTYIPARVRLARIQARRGEAGAADQYYAALAIAPGDADVYEALGDLYMSRGEYAQAMSHYEFATRFRPDQPGPRAKFDRARHFAGIAESRNDR